MPTMLKCPLQSYDVLLVLRVGLPDLHEYLRLLQTGFVPSIEAVVRLGSKAYKS